MIQEIEKVKQATGSGNLLTIILNKLRLLYAKDGIKRDEIDSWSNETSKFTFREKLERISSIDITDECLLLEIEKITFSTIYKTQAYSREIIKLTYDEIIDMLESSDKFIEKCLAEIDLNH